MHGHDEEAGPAGPKRGALDQTPEERAQARKRLDDVLRKKGPVTMHTPLGRLQVGRGDERGFEEEDVPDALSKMREIWQSQGQMGSTNDPTMRMPSVFKEETADASAALGWEDLPSSGQSTYDSGEAVRRAREAFRATLRREGKLRE